MKYFINFFMSSQFFHINEAFDFDANNSTIENESKKAIQDYKKRKYEDLLVPIIEQFPDGRFINADTSKYKDYLIALEGAPEYMHKPISEKDSTYYDLWFQGSQPISVEELENILDIIEATFLKLYGPNFKPDIVKKLSIAFRLYVDINDVMDFDTLCKILFRHALIVINNFLIIFNGGTCQLLPESIFDTSFTNKQLIRMELESHTDDICRDLNISPSSGFIQGIIRRSYLGTLNESFDFDNENNIDKEVESSISNYKKRKYEEILEPLIEKYPNGKSLSVDADNYKDYLIALEGAPSNMHAIANSAKIYYIKFSQTKNPITTDELETVLEDIKSTFLKIYGSNFNPALPKVINPEFSYKIKISSVSDFSKLCNLIFKYDLYIANTVYLFLDNFYLFSFYMMADELNGNNFSQNLKQRIKEILYIGTDKISDKILPGVKYADIRKIIDAAYNSSIINEAFDFSDGSDNDDINQEIKKVSDHIESNIVFNKMKETYLEELYDSRYVPVVTLILSDKYYKELVPKFFTFWQDLPEGRYEKPNVHLIIGEDFPGSKPNMSSAYTIDLKEPVSKVRANITDIIDLSEDLKKKFNNDDGSFKVKLWVSIISGDPKDFLYWGYELGELFKSIKVIQIDDYNSISYRFVLDFMIKLNNSQRNLSEIKTILNSNSNEFSKVFKFDKISEEIEKNQDFREEFFDFVNNFLRGLN